MKKLRKKLFVLGILTIVALFLFLISLLSFSPNKIKVIKQFVAQRNEASGAAKIASPSAFPKRLVHPANFGRQTRVPILTYHYIGNNPNPADKARDNLEVVPDKFEEQMNYLSKNGYNTISFDTLYAVLHGVSSLPLKPVILTFDDGYIDFYLNAYPILRRYGLHAVSFIPTGLVGKGYYMSWPQIKEIDASGLVSFQAHSVDHPNLAGLSDDKLKYQIWESKKALEAELGKPVNTFAYPYGVTDERVWAAVKAAGFVGAVGTWYGVIESEGTIYDMPRVKIGGGMTIEKFPSLL